MPYQCSEGFGQVRWSFVFGLVAMQDITHQPEHAEGKQNAEIWGQMVTALNIGTKIKEPMPIKNIRFFSN